MTASADDARGARRRARDAERTERGSARAPSRSSATTGMTTTAAAQQESREQASARSHDVRAARPWRDVLCCLPLLVGYEIAVADSGGAYRNGSDLLLALPLRPLGEAAWIARAGVLVALAVLAIGRVHRSAQPLLSGALRVAAESALAALVLGPLLLVALRLVPQEARELGLSRAAAGELPPLSRIGLVAGGAVFEELVFRLGVYGLVFLIVRRGAWFLGARRAAGALADVAAVALSALAFASFHLAAFNAWLGPGGEAFGSSLFTWRVAAGVALALLWRWRGFAVAAWTHALFNTALLLGAGPGVLL